MKRFAYALAAGALALGTALLPGVASAQDKKITVVTWNIAYFDEGFQKWVDAFKKIHPDFDVERIDMKGTEIPTWYQTQVVAGTPPDIVDVQGGLWLQYASQGGLTDLTPLLERDKDSYTKDMSPEVLANWVYEGKNYGVPLYVSKTLLFLNRNMMKAAGITKDPESFDEMMADAEKMTGGENTGLMTLNFDWLYWPLFAMNGVNFVGDDGKAAFNTPEAVALVKKLADWTAKGVINKISWTGRWVEPNGAFAAGNVGMLHAHAPAFLWFKSKADWVNEDSVGAMNMPGGWSTPNSHSLVMSAGSKHPDEAWDFMKIATSGDGAYAMGTGTNNLTGDMTVNAKLMDYFKANLPAVVPVLETQFQNLDKQTGNWPFAEDAAIKDAFYPELQAALLGEKSAEDALKSAEDKVNRILARQ